MRYVGNVRYGMEPVGSARFEKRYVGSVRYSMKNVGSVISYEVCGQWGMV